LRHTRQPGAATSRSYLVQLTLAPRVRKGIRATLEDADDFGYVTFDEDGFVYEGDAITLRVPFQNLRQVWQQNVGWRGRFVYGPRVTIEVDGLKGIAFIEFAERSSLIISQSKRTARELAADFEAIRAKCAHSSSSSSNSSSPSSSSSLPNSMRSACSTKPSEAFSTASQGSPFSARG